MVMIKYARTKASTIGAVLGRGPKARMAMCREGSGISFLSYKVTLCINNIIGSPRKLFCSGPRRLTSLNTGMGVRRSMAGVSATTGAISIGGLIAKRRVRSACSGLILAANS